ncbi:MAG: hypothetical protein DRI34_08255 [Deltaproteobacteria bacterium]|nr:MAG: hypothetical protein DRI34_08255 [Deltaproteobacteria bacterium]
MRKLIGCGLVVALAGMLACGVGTEDGPGLQLAFARQPLDAPCPELPGEPGSAPVLDAVELTLLRADGTVHFRKRVSPGSDGKVRVGGIAAGEDLTLEVRGLVSGQVAWYGSAAPVNIRQGVDTTVGIFLAAVGDVSCAARPLQAPRAFLAAAGLPGGRVLLAGGVDRLQADGCGPGCDAWQATAAVDMYDPATGIIYPVARLHTPRALASATLMPDGRVLVVGGVRQLGLQAGSGMFLQVAPGDVLASFEVYLPGPDVWIEKTMPQGMVLHSASLLPDGRVLLAGGGTAPDEEHASNFAYLYDPGLGSAGEVVKVTSAMATRRLGHAAVVTAAGKVLLIGGAIYPTAPPLEEFTPSAEGGVFLEKLSSGLPANLMFAGAAIIPLRPDEVFVAGGRVYDGQVLQPPVTGNSRLIRRISSDDAEWQEGPALASPRWLAGMVTAGRELVLAGGFGDEQLTPSREIEVFDPQGELAAAGQTSVERAGHAAVPLVGGQVLLAGGLGPQDVLRSAELFTPAALAGESEQ